MSQTDFDGFFDSIDGGQPARLYDELAPLYDFIYQRHYDYSEQLAVVQETAPNNVEAVLELACGNGRLLSLLEKEYADVVGVDVNSGMLSLASSQVQSAELLQADVTEMNGVSFDAGFQVVCMLGNAAVHFLVDEDIEVFLEASYEALDDGGVLVFDFMRADDFKNGLVVEHSFESEAYRVDRTIVNVLDSPLDKRRVQLSMCFSYKITEKTSGEVKQFGEVMHGRAFHFNEVREHLQNAGFNDIVLEEDRGDSAAVENLAVAVKR